MKNVVITKLQSISAVEVCDSLFREYMHWLILQTFAFMKSAVKMYKTYRFEEVNAFEGFEGAEHDTGGVELYMVKRNY